MGMSEKTPIPGKSYAKVPFHRVFTCTSFCNARVVMVCSCNDYLRCKYCGGKRGRRNKTKILNKLKLMDYHKKKGEGLKLLTLTMARTDCLKMDLDRLTRGFEVLRRRVAWKSRITHWVAVKEVTKGNVHLHIVALSTFWDHSSLSSEWEGITGNFIVDIRKVDILSAKEKLTPYLVKGTDQALIEEVAKIRDENKKMRFLLSSRAEFPSLLVIEAIVRHKDCPSCCGRMGYGYRFSRLDDAKKWLIAKRKKFYD